jgi:hypothetical protein
VQQTIVSGFARERDIWTILSEGNYPSEERADRVKNIIGGIG